MREKLKPCPFCGGKAELWKGRLNDGYAIRCSMCKSRTKIYDNQEYASIAWNRRAKE